MMLKIIRMSLLAIAGFICIALALFFSPPDTVLGNSVRLLYLHVPSAWLSVFAFVLSAVFSVKNLIAKNGNYAILSHASALIGFSFVIIATVSGAVWGSIAWGSAWNWDVREISIVLVLLVYNAYFVLYYSINSSYSRDRLAGVYLVAAALTVPFLVFILPRMTETLHPDIVSAEGGRPHLALELRMRIILFASIVYFTWLYFEILFCLFAFFKRRRDAGALDA